jgi:hypothetical protein
MIDATVARREAALSIIDMVRRRKAANSEL